MTMLAPILQAWFTDRMITERDSSPQTITAYRDTFRLLLAFASDPGVELACPCGRRFA
jgi:hypothetical protein